MAKERQKTTELMKLVANEKECSCIVCHSLESCTRIFHQSRALGLKINMPITYQNFVNKEYTGRYTNNFYIDDISSFLSFFTNKVKAITIDINSEDDLVILKNKIVLCKLISL